MPVGGDDVRIPRILKGAADFYQRPPMRIGIAIAVEIARA